MGAYPHYFSATPHSHPESSPSYGGSDQRYGRGVLPDDHQENQAPVLQPPDFRLHPIEPNVTLGPDEMALRMLPTPPGLIFRSMVPEKRPHSGHDGTHDEVETSGMQPPAPVRNARRMKPEAASPTPSGSSTQSSNKTKKTVTKRPPPKKPSRRKAPAKKRANKATSSANSVSRSLPHRPHQQERKALMVQFEELKAHTAKCDDCDNRNSEGMSRCKLCGWQCCRRCQAIRGGDKTHETVRGPHIPIGESPGAQITTSLVGTAGRLATAGRALSAFAADERMPPAAHMVADRTPTAAEQDAVRALMRMSSSPPAQIIGEFNAESPVSPSTSRSVSADDDHNRTLEDFSDVETVGGDSTITWHSSLDENDEQLESILEPLGLCRRNPPRASRPADMRD